MTMTVRETRMMDLRDQGWSVRRISEEMGVSATSVAKIVSMYDSDPTCERRYRQSMERANQQFLARLQTAREMSGRSM